MRNILLILLFILFFHDFLKESLEDFKHVEMLRVITDYDDSLEALLRRKGVKFEEVVAAQIFHETGMLKSDVYLNGNNMFGMKQSKKRHWAIGTYAGHAKYRNVSDSLYDYIEYQNTYIPRYEQRHGVKIHTNEDYINFLMRQNYAEDRKYDLKLKVWLERMEEVRRVEKRNHENRNQQHFLKN